MRSEGCEVWCGVVRCRAVRVTAAASKSCRDSGLGQRVRSSCRLMRPASKLRDQSAAVLYLLRLASEGCSRLRAGGAGEKEWG
jgi:hypothetical protein